MGTGIDDLTASWASSQCPRVGLVGVEIRHWVRARCGRDEVMASPLYISARIFTLDVFEVGYM
jgi:hypothetical protein